MTADGKREKAGSPKENGSPKRLESIGHSVKRGSLLGSQIHNSLAEHGLAEPAARRPCSRIRSLLLTLMSCDFEKALKEAAAQSDDKEEQHRITGKIMCGRLGISKRVWEWASCMLKENAILALALIDRNRFHSTRPVANPGGCLHAMLLRAEKGLLDIDAGIQAVQWRQLRGWQGR